MLFLVQRRGLLTGSRPSLCTMLTITGFEPSKPMRFVGPYLTRPVEDAPTLEEWRKTNDDPFKYMSAEERQRFVDTHKHWSPIFRRNLGYIYNKKDTTFRYGRIKTDVTGDGRLFLLKYWGWWMWRDYLHYFFTAPGLLQRWSIHAVLCSLGTYYFWRHCDWDAKAGEAQKNEFIAHSKRDHKMYVDE